MPVDQNILDKLQKLIALAASDNQHEAALAMEKAQALMNEHSLNIQDVAEDGSGAVIENKEVYGLTKSRQKWESLLSSAIATAFDGRAVVSRTEHGWHVTFIASKTEMAIIVNLFERLRQTVKRMSKSYVDSERSLQPWLPAKTLHNSYRRGMVLTINSRLKAFKDNTRPDSHITNQFGLTGMDLVMVKNQAVDQHIKELFGKTHQEYVSKVQVHAGAYYQGKEDGNKVSLHGSIDGKCRQLIPM